ncbi:Uncharacterised protein [Helicobacter fennelliae]|uniref:Uncharacterized protein n=1 Tax=Helicobacter fennelliae TaxID=215 RepID=A0A2X3EIW3_9HELI|nr:hypothetical protein [Helicobacter fennelliae]SQC36433.1 Uncharacterised protein [Helicobacter fennelliae]
MRILRFFFCCFAFVSFSYGAAASAAINTMNVSTLTLYATTQQQNNRIEKYLDLEKIVLLENKKAIFLAKQRNELLLNSLHIESTNER